MNVDISSEITDKLLMKKVTDIDLTKNNYAHGSVIIIGMGPVGITLANKLYELHYGGTILIFGEEPWEPYDRVKLSGLLAGELRLDNIQNKVSENGQIKLIYACIVSIDRKNKLVSDSKGKSWTYDTLVLALGSEPRVPSTPGIEKKGVFTFRDLRNAVQLSARMTRCRHVVIVGGGLLGLETAKAMLRHHTQVTIVQRSKHLMSNQLDGQSSELMRKHVLTLGIRVLLNTRIKMVLGDAAVKEVQLVSGHVLPCDTLIICTGIIPRTTLALNAGISIGKGIRVNDILQTTDESIYAIGECAEHREKIYGLVAPGVEQALVVANNLIGNFSFYIGSQAASRLKVVGINVFSIGAVGEEEYQLDLTQAVYRSSDNSAYRKLFLKNSRLLGAIVVGEWVEVTRIQEAVENARRLNSTQLRRFRRSGNVWSNPELTGISTWGNNAVICNCKSVQLGMLRAAVHKGCKTIDSLSLATGACTVCGSCRPLLAELLNSQKTTAIPGLKSLIASALLTLLAIIIWLLTPAITPGQSVGDWNTRVSQLWLDGTIKQISGYTLLLIILVSLLLSLRKRIGLFKWGDFQKWRLLHTWLGGLLPVILIVHTGFSFGENFNALLMINFLMVVAVGVIAGLSFLIDIKGNARQAQKLKVFTAQSHIYVAWPLPVLIVFHIITVYYF